MYFIAVKRIKRQTRCDTWNSFVRKVFMENGGTHFHIFCLHKTSGDLSTNIIWTSMSTILLYFPLRKHMNCPFLKWTMNKQCFVQLMKLTAGLILVCTLFYALNFCGWHEKKELEKLFYQKRQKSHSIFLSNKQSITYVTPGDAGYVLSSEFLIIF